MKLASQRKMQLNYNLRAYTKVNSRWNMIKVKPFMYTEYFSARKKKITFYRFVDISINYLSFIKDNIFEIKCQTYTSQKCLKKVFFL